MPESNSAFLLLGGNLGNVSQTLNLAITAINTHVGTVVRQSSTFESEPWGMGPANSFINQALEIKTDLLPLSLLDNVLRIESDLGRIRNSTVPESRIIDIDVLLYNDLVYKTNNLVIPHPRLHLRRFALTPLAQIAPGIIHPIFGKSIAELLKECQDRLHVAILN